jgi:hypothetical protein
MDKVFFLILYEKLFLILLNSLFIKGLINLWKDVLECFPMVSCDQAQAICLAYPSPLLLKKVFIYFLFIQIK